MSQIVYSLKDIPRQQIKFEMTDHALSSQVSDAPIFFLRAFFDDDEKSPVDRWKAVVTWDGVGQTSPLKQGLRGHLFVSLETKSRYGQKIYRECYLE